MAGLNVRFGGSGASDGGSSLSLSPGVAAKPLDGVDVRREMDSEIYVRLVDDASGGWGHINFDDFRLYARKPANVDSADLEPLKEDVVNMDMLRSLTGR